LAAHLVQSGKNMLNPGPHAGDGGVATLLACAERLAALGFALHLHAPARCGQARLARAIDVALVRAHLTRGIGLIEQILKVVGVSFTAASVTPKFRS